MQRPVTSFFHMLQKSGIQTTLIASHCSTADFRELSRRMSFALIIHKLVYVRQRQAWALAPRTSENNALYYLFPNFFKYFRVLVNYAKDIQVLASYHIIRKILYFKDF